MTWESGESRLVVSDVITWAEPVWPPYRARSRKKKKYPWGTQKIIAQITAMEEGRIELTVLRAEIIENRTARTLKMQDVGEVITKKHQTILRGDVKRLHWSEEDVRAALLSAP